MNLYQNLWTILFLIVAGQGFFLSILLFITKSSFARANKVLAVLLLLFSLNLLENVAYWTMYLVEIPHLANTTATFIYLYGPLFYFFMLLKLDHNRRLGLWDVLHFIPFFFFTIQMTGYYALSAESKVYGLQNQGDYFSYWTFVAHGLIALQMILYTFLSFKKIKQKSNTENTLNHLVIAFGLYASLVIFYLIMVDSFSLSTIGDYVISFGVAIMIYYIGYASSSKPYFFNSFLVKRKSVVKYEKSQLSKEESKRLFENLKTQVEENKLYLKSDLRVHELAQKNNTSVNNVSQSINQQTGMTFLDYINYHRVKEAQDLLAKGAGEKLTMLGIAYQVGFNNKTSFNRFFKKYTGLTPKEYVSEKLQLN